MLTATGHPCCLPMMQFPPRWRPGAASAMNSMAATSKVLPEQLAPKMQASINRPGTAGCLVSATWYGQKLKRSMSSALIGIIERVCCLRIARWFWTRNSISMGDSIHLLWRLWRKAARMPDRPGGIPLRRAWARTRRTILIDAVLGMLDSSSPTVS